MRNPIAPAHRGRDLFAPAIAALAFVACGEYEIIGRDASQANRHWI